MGDPARKGPTYEERRAALLELVGKPAPVPTPGDGLADRRAAVCTGKDAYDSEILARRAAGDIRARNRSIVLHAYQCPICRRWHLGSDRGQRNRRMR